MTKLVDISLVEKMIKSTIDFYKNLSKDYQSDNVGYQSDIRLGVLYELLESLKLLPTHNKWISADTIPTIPGEYIVFDDGLVTTQFFIDGDWKFKGKSITHWMKMPLPPNK